jgi:hypothetical protein
MRSFSLPFDILWGHTDSYWRLGDGGWLIKKLMGVNLSQN